MRNYIESDTLKNNNLLNTLVQLFVIFFVLMVNIAVFINSTATMKVVVALFSLFVIYVQSKQIMHFAFLFVFMAFTDIYIPQNLMHIPVVGFIVPLILSSFVMLLLQKDRQTFNWIRKGQIQRSDLILIFSSIIISVIALILWAYWSNYLGIGKMMIKDFSSKYPSWFIITIAIPLFAFVNAITEEGIYRGVILNGLLRIYPDNYVANLLQASLFACAHYSLGFPNGKLGYLMTALYGYFLGYMRIRTKGILACIIIHVFADLCIAIVLYSTLF